MRRTVSICLICGLVFALAAGLIAEQESAEGQVPLPEATKAEEKAELIRLKNVLLKDAERQGKEQAPVVREFFRDSASADIAALNQIALRGANTDDAQLKSLIELLARETVRLNARVAELERKTSPRVQLAK